MIRDLSTYKTIYFIGIGGIGMSALARYFKHQGHTVLGYDKTSTQLTQQLENEGISIHYTDQPEILGSLNNEDTLVVYTPAVPHDHQELVLAQAQFTSVKRAAALGMISNSSDTIAVAGTHGKTTTSCMIAHLFASSSTPVNAFLGGISSNFNSNLVVGNKDSKVVLEADEFDRSFLHLSPNTAIVTSMDADHLDIYNTDDNIKSAFFEFIDLLAPCGHLIMKCGLEQPAERLVHTYGFEDQADLSAHNLRVKDGHLVFDLSGIVEAKGVQLGMPGKHNVENSLAAILAGLLNGLSIEDIIEGLRTFAGVKRRFEYRIRKENLVYIDDYAHHPTELEQCIGSVRQLYPGKKITGVFQPHLYSRTKDFAQGFAESLALLDELYLLDIYPARELPIPGISSQWLLEQVKMERKQLCAKKDLVRQVLDNQPEILLTLGAGDIDTLVAPLTEALS